jgi:outer membrane protein assembly factor BamB
VKRIGVLCLTACAAAWGLEIDRVWMTGRWPLESAPLMVDFDGDGTAEILGLNRGGELVLWHADGTAFGPGPDGVAGRLPEAKWSSSPSWIPTDSGPLVVACNTDGLVIALDTDFAERWRYHLPANTEWGRAVPAVVHDGGEPRLCFMDSSGTLTALKPDGTEAWSLQASEKFGGPSPAAVTLRDGREYILAPLGAGIACVSPDGQVLWNTKLSATTSADPDLVNRVPVVRSRPELLQLPDRELIVCLAAGGQACALTTSGDLAWTLQMSGELDGTPAFLPQADGPPLIVFSELWGNLHAVTADGKRVWTHLYRSKVRCTPLVVDADGDGDKEIVVPTFAQHVYVFDETGRLVDDVRLNGLANPSAFLLTDPASGRTDVFEATASLLAYRLRPSTPVSPYPLGKEAGAVNLSWESPDEGHVLRIDNPSGRFLRVNVETTGAQGLRHIVGAITSRSFADLELPPALLQDAAAGRADACDADGSLVTELLWDSAAFATPGVVPGERFDTGISAVWATPAYGTFSEDRMGRCRAEDGGRLELAHLYMGEVDQAAFVVQGEENETRRYRIELYGGDKPFGGTIRYFQVVTIDSRNGAREVKGRGAFDRPNRDRVADALLPLGPANVLTVPAGKAVKIWVSVDARGAVPGTYGGTIVLSPLDPPYGPSGPQIAMAIFVTDLAMPKQFPLSLCTWDYVPNKWFPEHTDTVLDDMQRHGVDVFPRSGCLPPASFDASTVERLTVDWSNLDAELDRLRGRGQILFQLTHPTITYATPPTDAEKWSAEIEYFWSFRDHLIARGLDFDDYAFYPVDEPGLNYEVGGVDALLDAAKLFRQADPGFRGYTDPVPTLSREDFDRIDPVIDVWCPNMRLVTGLLAKDPRMERIMASDKPVWSYECVGQVKSLSPLRYNRANAWRAAYFGLDGIGFWTHSQTQENMWYPSDEEYALVYPGEIPVASVRWEAVRDGLEDVAAMALLQQHIDHHERADTAAEFVMRANEALRIARNDIMQISDLAFVESRDYLDAGDRRIWHTWADVETYRRHREAIADLTLTLRNISMNAP